MATTFQADNNSSNKDPFADFFTEKNFSNALTDILTSKLNKLNIDSRFLNDIADKAATVIANKNISVDTSKFKTSAKSTTEQSQTKTTQDKTTSAKKEKTSVSNTDSTKQNVKSRPLNVTNNTFKIVNTPKQDTKLLDIATKLLPEQNTKILDTTTKQDTILDRFLKTIEKTTNKLEETVKEIPRPWELTPGTSIGYQMLAGDDKAMTERIRKGIAQFIGRYTTNIKDPSRYVFPDLSNPKALIKDILKDSKFDSKITTGANLNARETLYRELFDLPTRANKDILDQTLLKTGNKQYTIVDPSLTPKPLKGFRENAGPGYYGKPASHATINPILGGTYLNALPNKAGYTYKDVWDLITSGENSKTTGVWDGDAKSYWARTLTAPLLRPATVSGTIDKEGAPLLAKTTTAKSVKQIAPPQKNWSENLTKEVSTKLEKMPVFTSLTKGLKDFKNNKIIDGLKGISSLAPSVQPIISFLSSREEPIQDTGNTQLTNLSESYSELKDRIKDSTITKLTSWTDNLYNWSEDKITSFTKTLEDTFKEVEGIEVPKFNIQDINKNKITDIFTQTKDKVTEFTKTFDEQINLINGIEIPKLEELKETKLKAEPTESLANSIVQETPSLQKTIDTDNVKINNETLDKIALNTETANNTMKLLGDAMLRLVQVFANKSSDKGNNIIVAGNNTQSQPQTYPSASQVAASNIDPISLVRQEFLYS